MIKLTFCHSGDNIKISYVRHEINLTITQIEYILNLKNKKLVETCMEYVIFESILKNSDDYNTLEITLENILTEIRQSKDHIFALDAFLFGRHDPHSINIVTFNREVDDAFASLMKNDFSPDQLACKIIHILSNHNSNASSQLLDLITEQLKTPKFFDPTISYGLEIPNLTRAAGFRTPLCGYYWGHKIVSVNDLFEKMGFSENNIIGSPKA